MIRVEKHWWYLAAALEQLGQVANKEAESPNNQLYVLFNLLKIKLGTFISKWKSFSKYIIFVADKINVLKSWPFLFGDHLIHWRPSQLDQSQKPVWFQREGHYW